MLPVTPSLKATLEALKNPHPRAEYKLLPLKQGNKTVYLILTKDKRTKEITFSISESIPVSPMFTAQSEDGSTMIIGSAWDILNLINF